MYNAAESAIPKFQYPNASNKITSPYVHGMALIGLFLLGSGTSFVAERSSHWREYLQGRVPFIVEKKGSLPAPTSTDEAMQVDTRSPGAHIENIKSGLLPSVSDLAAVLGVTRQSIYKWIAESAFPDEGNMLRLAQLSRVADAFSAADVKNASKTVKMKMFNGKSFIDLLKEQKDTSEAISILISESRIMETAYEKSKIAQSKAPSNSSWQSDLSHSGSFI